MPHQCVRCSNLYDDGAEELLKGCNCGGKFFFFMKKRDIKTVKEMTVKLTEDDKKQMEKNNE